MGGHNFLVLMQMRTLFWADLNRITAAQGELDDYATGLVAERKGCPHADLVSDLVQASYDEDRLSVDELVAMIEAILLAGTDTTRNQLGSLLAVLAGQPDQYQAVRNDRSLVPAVVEESLRYIGAVRTARVASEDRVVDGMFFPAGTTVLLGLHAAGLGQPDDGFRFDLERGDRAPHLAFGFGSSSLLGGAALARAELQEALNSFLDVVPAYRLSAPVTWKPFIDGNLGPETLNLRFLIVLSKTAKSSRLVN